jgi:hypothetical protein
MLPETHGPDMVRESEAFLLETWERTGVPLGPKPERVTDQYADERILEKIEALPEEKQRAGLWSVNKVLKERDVPPALRLHLITAVAHLGRIGQDTLEARRDRSVSNTTL